MIERVRLDNFLFEELKSGNTRAFDKIFKDHYPNLYRLAYSIVHDEDTAHRPVQKVFVTLWENCVPFLFLTETESNAKKHQPYYPGSFPAFILYNKS